MESSQENGESDPNTNRNPDWGAFEAPLLITFMTCDIEPSEQYRRTREAREKYIHILDDGRGYETLLKMDERMRARYERNMEKVNEATKSCKLHSADGPGPPLRIRERAGTMEYYGEGEPEDDRSWQAMYFTEPPYDAGFRAFLVTDESLRQSPYEAQDPEDIAVFWVMKHRFDLLQIAECRKRVLWLDKNLNALNRVLAEFEIHLDVDGPPVRVDLDNLGPEDPAFFDKMKAIRDVLKKYPELKEEKKSAPIFRAVLDEGDIISEAQDPVNTIGRGINKNFSDHFPNEPKPYSGKDWAAFIRMIQES